jgi:hypothetical protein
VRLPASRRLRNVAAAIVADSRIGCTQTGRQGTLVAFQHLCAHASRCDLIGRQIQQAGNRWGSAAIALHGPPLIVEGAQPLTCGDVTRRWLAGSTVMAISRSPTRQPVMPWSQAAAGCDQPAPVASHRDLDRAPDRNLVLSASGLALLGQRRGQRSTLCYLRLPKRSAFLSCCLSRTTLAFRPPPDYGSGGWGFESLAARQGPRSEAIKQEKLLDLVLAVSVL